MNLVKSIVLENRRSFIILLITSILSGGLNATFLAVVTYILSGAGGDLDKLIFLFAGACLGILAIRQLHRYIAIEVANKATNQLRVRLGRLINNCSAASIEKKGEASLLTVLTQDIGTITDFILYVPSMLGNVTFLIGATVYLAYLSEIGIFVGMILVIVLVFKLYSKVMSISRTYYRRVREESEILMGYQTDLVAGYKELKMDAAKGEKLIEDCVKPANERRAEALLKAGVRHAFGLNFGTGLIYLFIGMVIFTFPVLLGYSSEVVLGYVIAIIYAAGPLQSVAEIYPMLIRARISIEKIQSLEVELEDLQEHHVLCDAGREVGSFSTIELADVEFSYSGRGGEVVRLGPFDMRLHKGEVVFLCGGNGSGKTTLAKLLCGLYIPESGDIMLDGRAVERADLRRYRRYFSTVFSDFHILKNSAAIYDLTRIPRNSLAAGFGLDASLFASGGVANSDEISQGQRRRLAILMAVDAERPVYIFDEPGSDLDPDFKRFFYNTVLPHLKANGATVVVVTHDDNYFDFADRLLVLRDGKIVSRMTPDAAPPDAELARDGSGVPITG